MRDEVPNNLEIDREFYERMQRANVKLEDTLKGENEESNTFGIALIIFGLIILSFVILSMNYMFQKIV